MLKTYVSPGEARSFISEQQGCAMAFHLESGDPICAFLTPAKPFCETQRFDPTGKYSDTVDVTDWFCDELESLIGYAEELAPYARPMILPLPDAAIANPHLAGVADEYLAKTYVCPQEISFELTDATLVNHTSEALIVMQAFRRRGFRMSIDARRSWDSTLPAFAWLMVDTVRIDPVSLSTDQKLCDYISAATDAGVSVVAMKPSWRDSYFLSQFGVEYGVEPKADA